MNPVIVSPDFLSQFEALCSFDPGSFAAMPTLGAVAATMIADELRAIYPGLALVNTELKVAVPEDISQDNRQYRFTSLVTLMLERATGM